MFLQLYYIEINEKFIYVIILKMIIDKKHIKYPDSLITNEMNDALWWKQNKEEEIILQEIMGKRQKRITRYIYTYYV